MVSPPLPRTCHTASHRSNVSMWVCPGTEVRLPPKGSPSKLSKDLLLPPRPPGRQMERVKARVRDDLEAHGS